MSSRLRPHRMNQQRPNPQLHLYVVGESSGNPAEWNPYEADGTRILVFAASKEDAKKKVDFPGDVHQVLADEPCIVSAQFSRV